MVESIIHAVDQYQSQASGADIGYKMGQKVKNGGSVGRANLGYLNVREAKPEGGEIRTIAVDPERAPLITRGFELYATGQYTARHVLDQLTTAGLRTRPTRNRAAKPLSLSQFYLILTDTYYTGKVTYDGQEYPGRHTPMVSEELFGRVQRVLVLRGGGGSRQRRHTHWLKGLLWCHRCGRRMVIARGKGNGGIYFYFFCRGRQQHVCDLPYLSVGKIEAAVERHFATVRLREAFQALVRHQLDEALLGEQGTLSQLRRRLKGRLDELDTREDGLLDLVGDPDWPKEKIKGRLVTLEQERADVQSQLADTVSKLAVGRQFFITALDLLSDPRGFYQRGGSAVKRALTKVIFDRVHLDAEQVGGHELAEGVRGLIEAGSDGARRQPEDAIAGLTALRAAGGTRRDSNSKGGSLQEEGAAFERLTDADLFEVVLADHGSSRAAMVELRGLEPLTP